MNTIADQDEKPTDEQVDALVTHVAQATSITNPDSLSELGQAFRDYPADLIQQLLDKASENKLTSLINLQLSRAENSITAQEALCYYPYLTTISTHFAGSLLNSLRHYPQLPELDDYSTADENTKKQCAAIMVATEIIYSEISEFISSPSDDEGNFLDLIKDPKLVDLLIERPEQAVHIATLVVDRVTTDVDIIKAVLDHENPALAEGIL